MKDEGCGPRGAGKSPRSGGIVESASAFYTIRYLLCLTSKPSLSRFVKRVLIIMNG